MHLNYCQTYQWQRRRVLLTSFYILLPLWFHYICNLLLFGNFLLYLLTPFVLYPCHHPNLYSPKDRISLLPLFVMRLQLSFFSKRLHTLFQIFSNTNPLNHLLIQDVPNYRIRVPLLLQCLGFRPNLLRQREDSLFEKICHHFPILVNECFKYSKPLIIIKFIF